MNNFILELLADHLHKLPDNYQKFDMRVFIEENIRNKDHKFPSRPEILINEKEIPCGTVACALGHAPIVEGIPKPDKGEDWLQYSYRIFGFQAVDTAGIQWDTLSEEEDNIWDWMFSDNWTHIDNTPKGAAERIYWFIKNGLPVDWEEQMDGEKELCYKGFTL